MYWFLRPVVTKFLFLHIVKPMNRNEARTKTKACSVCEKTKVIHGNYRISQTYKNGNVTYRTECNDCMTTKIEISTFFRAIEKRDFLHGVIKRIDKKSENDAQYAKRMYKLFSVVAETIKEHNPKSFIARPPQMPAQTINLPRASHQRPIQQPKPVQQRTPSSSYSTQSSQRSSVSSSVITRPPTPASRK